MTADRRPPTKDPTSVAAKAGALAAVRFSWGTLLVVDPAIGLRLLGAEDTSAARRVLRLLGARHVVQSVLTLAWGRSAATAGSVVDLVHSATAIVFGALARRWRRAAFTDASVAMGLSVSGLLTRTDP